MRRTLALLPLVALLAGCTSDDEPPACTPEREKAAVLDLARDWYLYPELLPAQVDLAAYAGPAELLDALTATARAEGKDRGWSFATTATAAQQLFAEGTTVGFGIGLLVRGDRLFVSQVFPASPAADAGFLRGDEIVSIGDPPVAVAGLVAAGTVGEALGPATGGVTRRLEVVPRGGSAAFVRTMTKRTYFLDPVPPPVIVPRPGLPPAGYVALRTFIGPADALLQQAFADFGAAGVTDVVVDLRYNGGGLVSTAELLANLLGGGLGGQVMYRVENNSLHPSSGPATFAPGASSLPLPGRIAFVVTGGSASSSELVPNVLEPGREIALVGARTHGKPVGQRGFSLSGCDLVVFLVSFRLVNSQDDGDYFDGLPDAAGRFEDCAFAAADDLTREMWDPDEASTSAAIAWLTPGAACPVAPLSALSATLPDAYPEAPRPSDAQRHVRGLF
jgi:C-terminal processing protease CtpA/Prc